jgi:ABC-2 type transport system permease protein
MTEHALAGRTARPAAGAGGVGWWRAAWRQYRLERRMFWRNPSAAFFNIALPLLFLALFGAIFAGSDTDLDVIVPGIAGMSVMATTFSALAYNLVFLREQGILKRIRGTPLPSSAYLVGIAASAVTNCVAQVAVITVVGRVAFGVAWPTEWLALFVFVALGVVCFAALGVALAHAIPNVESATAYVNAVFLPVIVISGVFYDADRAPTWLHDIAQALPLTHLIDGLSGAMVHHEGLGDHWGALLVLGVWATLAIALAVRGFSWEARRS